MHCVRGKSSQLNANIPWGNYVIVVNKNIDKQYKLFQIMSLDENSTKDAPLIEFKRERYSESDE